MENRTKIVATIGPASRDDVVLRGLIEAGMDVARVNFSHGTHEEHAQTIHKIKQFCLEAGKAVCLLQDLQGPKIRVGELPGGICELKRGDLITLTTQNKDVGQKCIPVDFPGLPQSVKRGGRILLDDGNLELRVNDFTDNEVYGEVIVGGLLKSRKGINLPGAKLDIPSMTRKDEADLAFGLERGVNLIALSFVRTKEDVVYLNNAIQHSGTYQWPPLIIAKLEKPEALDNLDEILEVADGVMVARGDLGVEMSPQEVPIAQKHIIQTANRHGKLVITATQMLDSMIHNPRPTRAEASDVANAIFDGTDAVMLSGETATGMYPIQAVKMMADIIQQAEAHSSEWGHWGGEDLPEARKDDTYFMTQAARELAHNRNVAAVAVFTKSGRTALLMSKARPRVPILAFTSEMDVYPRMAAEWGVIPYLVPHVEDVEGMLTAVEKAMLESGSIQTGQQVVLICGFPVHDVRPTNLALLHTVGQSR